MPRTIISLEETDKAWLHQEARRRHVPMTEIVRRAVRAYRRQTEPRNRTDLDEVLECTRGIWTHGDGLEYQRAIRAEWETEIA